MSESERGANVSYLPPPPPRRRESRLDRAIGPYFREPGLWPVMLVLVVHLVLGAGMALLDAWRSRAGFAVGTLVVAGSATLAVVASDLRRRRLGLASRVLLASWALGAVAGWAADRWGIY